MGEGKRQKIALAHKFDSGRRFLENTLRGAPALIPCAVLGIVCCSDLHQPWKLSSPQLLEVMFMNPKGIFDFHAQWDPNYGQFFSRSPIPRAGHF